MAHNMSHIPQNLNPQDAVGLPFKNILVADDNYASRTIMKTLLEREDCDVSLAHNGRIAIQLSAIERFDLILMDLQMPIIDGFESAAAIRKTCRYNRKTPIFAVTAYADTSITDAVKAVGMNKTLLKPFRIGDIVKAWNRSHQTEVLAKPMHADTTTFPKTGHDFALLDKTVLSPLCDAAPADMLSRLIDRFWASTEGFIERLHDDLPEAITGDASSIESFRRSAHALKGSAANIGILKGSKLAAQLQNAKPANMKPLLTDLVDCLDITRPELNSFIAIHALPTTTANPHPGVAQTPGIDAQTG
ncbi:response regulator [Fretibacter rubidus]|uniref:response regulator n=1 Tax=Fretibacter rubidus TaxID=570162 RepID=UPI00352B9DDC